jgi:hypothetical protein
VTEIHAGGMTGFYDKIKLNLLLMSVKEGVSPLC